MKRSVNSVFLLRLQILPVLVQTVQNRTKLGKRNLQLLVGQREREHAVIVTKKETLKQKKEISHALNSCNCSYMPSVCHCVNTNFILSGSLCHYVNTNFILSGSLCHYVSRHLHMNLSNCSASVKCGPPKLKQK